MKILEPGRPQQGWSTEATCTGFGNGGGGCGAKLLVEQGDLFQTFIFARTAQETCITFRCAACGVETDVGGVPGHVAAGLPIRRAWRAARNLDPEPRSESGK